MEPEPIQLPPGLDAKSAIEVLSDAFIKQFEKLHGRVRQLETRLAEIEAKGIEFKGEYQRALDYRRGALVQYGGSLWAAVVAVEPGNPPPGEAWQLCVRALSAGRDDGVAAISGRGG